MHPPPRQSFWMTPTYRHIRNDNNGIAIVTPMVHPMHHRPVPLPTPLANPIAIHPVSTDGANVVVIPAIHVPPWNNHHHPPLPRSQSPPPSTPAKINSHVIQITWPIINFLPAVATAMRDHSRLDSFSTVTSVDSCFLSASSPLEFPSINYHKILPITFFLSFFKEGEGLRKTGMKIWWGKRGGEKWGKEGWWEEVWQMEGADGQMGLIDGQHDRMDRPDGNLGLTRQGKWGRDGRWMEEIEDDFFFFFFI